MNPSNKKITIMLQEEIIKRHRKEISKKNQEEKEKQIKIAKEHELQKKKRKCLFFIIVLITFGAIVLSDQHILKW